MGLATLPSPAEGVLCVVMVNTAISINILKDIFRSVLQVVGINYPPPNSDPCAAAAFTSSHPDPVVQTRKPRRKTRTELYVEEFRNRNPAVRFYSVCISRNKKSRDNCSVCLTRFKPVSEVNQLDCGHVFHKECLEKWMVYRNTTCPLCRTPMMPPHDQDDDDDDDDDEDADTMSYY